jgi:hypothetical protein
MKTLKNYKLVLFLASLSIIGCNSAEDDLIGQSGITIGETAYPFHYVNLEPDSILPSGFQSGPGDDLSIDIDSDGIDDLHFEYWFDHGMQGTARSFGIKTINPEVSILVIDSKEDSDGYPSIYTKGDFISTYENYKSGNFTLISDYWDSGQGGFVEKDRHEGIWFDIDNRYIAIKLSKRFGPWLGWVKIGLIEGNSKLIVYSFGSTEVVY